MFFNFDDPLIIDPVITFLYASKQRKMWCRPIYSTRRSESEYATLYPKLLQDPEKFQNYARMSHQSFLELHDLIKHDIHPEFTNYRDSISTEERLLITLRYLASGTSFQHIGYNYRVSHNHVGYIVEETCRALWERLKPICLPTPDREAWERIADEYYRLWNFPHCIGAIDGKHVRIQCPSNAGSLYYNYKDYHSIVVQAVADAHYKFVALDIGDYGRNSDGSIFRESVFGRDFENCRLDLPPSNALPNTDQELPFVFLADEAYPLQGNLLTPYPRRTLSNPSRVFNARLSRARKSVECAFGLVTKQFEVLQRPIRCSVERATIIVQATFALHNFVREREGLLVEPTTENTVNNELPNLAPIVHSGLRAKEIRDGFRNYFVSSEGDVPWLTTHSVV